MMKKLSFVLVVAMLSAVSAPSAQAVTMFFDFGDSGSSSAASNYNDIAVNGVTQPIVLANTIDNTGAGTGIGLSVSGFFNGANFDGTQTPSGAATLFAASATRDSAFTHVGPWGNFATNPLGQIVFSGLNNASVYDFTMFASRMNVADNRETLYTATGSNSGTATLNAANNASNLVTIAGISPSAGSITLSVQKGPNNSNGTGFAYIGALRVVSSPAVPEPTTLGLVGITSLGLAFRRRSA